MAPRLSRHSRSLLAASLFALTACGGGGSDEGAAAGERPDAGAAGDDGDSGGDDQAHAGTDEDDDLGEIVEVFPPPEPDCADTQVRCRGACFDRVGQKKHGCELVRLEPKDSWDDSAWREFAQNVGVEGAIFTYGRAQPLTRIDTRDFSEQLLDPTPDTYVPYAADGWLYTGDDMGRFVRISADGATTELVHDPAGKDLTLVFEHEGYAYFREWEVPGISRAKLGDGPLEPFVSYEVEYGIVPTNERLFLVADDFDRELRSVSWANPNDYEVLYTNYDLGQLFVFEDAPDQLFFETNVIVGSVPRSGASDGASLALYDLDGLELISHLGVTSEQFIYYYKTGDGGPDPKDRIDALSLDGERRVAVDYASREGSVTEDADYYYLARGRGLFRIAKSEL